MAVAETTWAAKEFEASNEKMAAERLTLEKDKDIDKKRASIAKKQKEIDAEIKAFEVENASYYVVKKIGGSKSKQEQKDAKKSRAIKGKMVIKNGGIKCICGKSFQKDNSFYKKCMIKCKDYGVVSE